MNYLILPENSITPLCFPKCGEQCTLYCEKDCALECVDFCAARCVVYVVLKVLVGSEAVHQSISLVPSSCHCVLLIPCKFSSPT